MLKITAKDAAKIASEYYSSIAGKSTSYLSLEELEYDQKDGCWYVTLGYAPMAAILTASSSKEYKIFRIDGSSGEVLSMKIKSVK